MRNRLRKWWPLAKAVFTVAILVFVGRHFVRDLRNLDLKERSLHPGWLALSGVLYLAGLGLSAWFWVRLLRRLGQRPEVWQALRAYYLGHFGKYLPGKAWALVLRATLMRSPGVHAGVAGMAAFYEVLTTMAAGALLAALLFLFMGPNTTSGLDFSALRNLLTMGHPDDGVLDRNVLVLLAVCVLVPLGLPIVPPIFNRLVHHLSLPFREATAVPPRVPSAALVEGLTLAAGGWFLLGASLWAVVQSVSGVSPVLSWDTLGRYTAFLSLAYVVGFIIILVPSGLGIREYFLTAFLAPQLVSQLRLPEGEARAVAVLAVLLLRVVWTASELVLAGIIYWLPGPTAFVKQPGGNERT
jgi:uncharacterized membrane protein YbhN (UPF0104 family)